MGGSFGVSPLPPQQGTGFGGFGAANQQQQQQQQQPKPNLAFTQMRR
jgi:hypothetical protein